MKLWRGKKTVGRLSPSGALEGVKNLLLARHPCDRCGHSKIDGHRIADARYEVVTSNGSLYLCGHHYRLYSLTILGRGYEVKDHQE
jgi:hypothetical protein